MGRRGGGLGGGEGDGKGRGRGGEGQGEGEGRGVGGRQRGRGMGRGRGRRSGKRGTGGVTIHQSGHQQGYNSCPYTSAISDTTPIITHYHLQLTTLVGVPHSQPLLLILIPLLPLPSTPSPLTCIWWRSSCLLPPSPPHYW